MRSRRVNDTLRWIRPAKSIRTYITKAKNISVCDAHKFSLFMNP